MEITKLDITVMEMRLRPPALPPDVAESFQRCAPYDTPPVVFEKVLYIEGHFKHAGFEICLPPTNTFHNEAALLITIARLYYIVTNGQNCEAKTQPA